MRVHGLNYKFNFNFKNFIEKRTITHYKQTHLITNTGYYWVIHLINLLWLLHLGH